MPICYSLPRSRRLAAFLWLPLLATAAACNCGAQTEAASDGVKLVLPAGDTPTRTVNFGVVRVSAIATQPIELQNDSRVSVAITSMALTPGSSKNFYLKLQPGPLPSLGPGQTYNAQLRYQPSQIGTDTGTVIITTAAPSTPKYTINITGSGGASKIDVCSTDSSGAQVCALEQPNGQLTIDMGTVTPPGKTMSPLIVKSEGTLPLNVMSVQLTPTTPLDYTLQAGPFPTTIAVSDSSTYGVTFQPTLGGTETGAIQFNSDDPVNPRLIVQLTAVGDTPRMCVSPTTVQFGDVPINTTATQPVTITSCGAEPLTLPAMIGNIANVSITNDGSGSATSSPELFGEPMPPSLPQTLPVGMSITANFTFTPTMFGTANGKAIVGSEDGEEGIIGLQGTGVGCTLVAQPPAVNFNAGGAQVFTNSSASQSVNISNVGTGQCNITGFSIMGGASSPFSVTNPPATPITLMPGQSQAVTVTFTPASTAPASDDLLVASNASTALTVPLTGTGVAAPPCALVPNPASLIFANVQAGQSGTQNVVVTNVGTQACYIGGVSVNPPSNMPGESEAAYTVTPMGTAMGAPSFAPVEVDPGMMEPIAVTFAPTSATQVTGVIQINYGTTPLPDLPPLLTDPQNVYVPVTGGEVPPKICVSPASLNFGTVAVGQMPTKTFTITSCGSGTLYVRGLMMGPGTSKAFTIANGGPQIPEYLPSGSTADVTVQYAPTTTNGDFGNVVVLSNDPNTPHLDVPLQGNAQTTCATQLACTPDPLVFPTLPIGESAALSLTCLDVGTQSITVSGVSFGQGSASAFSTPFTGQTIMPGNPLRISINYIPTTAGSDDDTLTVSGDTCNTVSINLQGAAVLPNYPPCQPPQQFSPQVKWNWTGTGSTNPTSNNVEMSPVVVNLTDDNGDGLINSNDIPEVVFTSCTFAQCCLNCFNVMNFQDADFSGIGTLRAVHGKDGSEYFSVTDASLAVPANTQIATADLDGDNLPEIIAVQHSFHQGSGDMGLAGKYVSGVLEVFDHTGKLMFLTDTWTGDPNSFEFGSAPAIADLDQDGFPEIVFERSVFHYDGTKSYDMSESGNWGHGAFPTISDVNGDGKPDIVSGNYVYSGDGTLLWTAPNGLQAGPTMVLDINGDGSPEVILRDTPQSVQVLDGATGAVMASASWASPSTASNDPTQSGNGICSAAMAAADLDGDGNPELIIPAGDFIYTWKYTGTSMLTQMWQQPINDYMGQCGASGAAAFDFNGQGLYDVVYHDTQWLYVFDGTTGNIMYQTPRSSDTIFETPVIADIDNSGHTAIIMTNDGGGGTITGTLAGVAALSNIGNSWPETRNIWSDHAYHVSEISADDDVPVLENWSWKPGNNNSWRAQQPLCTMQ